VESIAFIEELAANAWPAAIVQHVDGWRLRFNWGATRRANSALPIADGGRYSLEEKTGFAERFYADRDLPCRFQAADATMPAGLDAYLADRGYVREAPTTVLTAELTALVTDERPPQGVSVDVAPAMTDEWTSLYDQANGLTGHDAELRRDIMRRVPVPAAYALARMDGEAVAVGWAAIERGWVGVFGMTTQPAFRRRGAGRAVLGALAGYAQRSGAHSVYLQVMDDNPAAHGLYAGAGLRPAYGYHYRTRQLARPKASG
jgi:N-acetylglutamate synthase